MTSRTELEAREAVNKEEKAKEPVAPEPDKTKGPSTSADNDSQVEHEGPRGPGR